jgi:hypothetical protein
MRATLVLFLSLGTCCLASVSLGATQTRRIRCGAAITRNGAHALVVGPVEFRGLRRAAVPLGSKVLILQVASQTPITIRAIAVPTVRRSGFSSTRPFLQQ